MAYKTGQIVESVDEKGGASWLVEGGKPCADEGNCKLIIGGRQELFNLMIDIGVLLRTSKK